MDLYYNLLKYPVFSVETIQPYYNNKESARTAMKRPVIPIINIPVSVVKQMRLWLTDIKSLAR